MDKKPINKKFLITIVTAIAVAVATYFSNGKSFEGALKTFCDNANEVDPAPVPLSPPPAE